LTLQPKFYHCSGWENHHIFGYCGLFAILFAGYYYGQDSLPDSANEIVKGMMNYFTAFGDCFKNLFQGVSEKAGAPPAELVEQGYSNFEQAPAGLEEEDDDEEEDIGRKLNQSADTEKLDYDSPEEFGK
jgi:hypothetical protein